MKQFRRLGFFLIILGIVIIFGLLGCNGDNNDNDNEPTDVTNSETGDVVISLTDAAGDFTNYTVDVVSVRLFMANGTEVDTLPVSTTVDFSQYVEMTEFLTVATIPTGTYTKAILTLDYQNANIWVENESGDSVQARIVDEDGNSITRLDVSVYLENKNRLIIAHGKPAHLSLDFDLKASNKVEFDQAGDAVVIVEPSLIAALEPEADKMNRLRGTLQQVNVDENKFRVIICPFFHTFGEKNERFGRLDVTVDGNTIYDINGDSFQGSDGLIAMNDLPQLTGVVVIGDLKFKPLRFEAREVTAGDSVPGGTQDTVKGNVIARSGNTITVKGANIIRRDGNFGFNNEIIVQLDENTKVTKQLSTNEYTIDDVSVGQQILIFGTVLDNQTEGQFKSRHENQVEHQTNEDKTVLEMDASNGYIRMQLTTLCGTAVETAPNDESAQLIMDIKAIDQRPASLFDFTGTGKDMANDANPENYEINAGNLKNLNSIASSAPVKVRGFVQPFGQAPADFTAQTIIQVAAARAYMKVNWTPPSETAFDSITSAGLTLNLEGTTRFHHVGRGRIITNLKDLDSAPTIQPLSSDGDGVFIIKTRKDTLIHKDFSDFVNDLNDYIQGGDSAVKTIFATGYFDDSTVSLSAKYLYVMLQ